ncbi:hypothetical protein [Nocardia sp. NPDC060249]|uniref:hypothetical protein n=1 Tax=Nocardia sp. NPDC060249 TaxID=3347082 RepID=UPI003648FDB3
MSFDLSVSINRSIAVTSDDTGLTPLTLDHAEQPYRHQAKHHQQMPQPSTENRRYQRIASNLLFSVPSPVLEEMLGFVRLGDTCRRHSMDCPPQHPEQPY